MTFHDEIHKRCEDLSYRGAKDLLLFVNTISPASPEVNEQVRRALLALAEDLEWPTEIDPMIGKVIA